MKILIIIGTRPEAIKLAPVIHELQCRQSDIKKNNLYSVVCTTAQHRLLLDQVLNLFNIVPDYDLDIMKENQTPAQVAVNVLTKLEPILQTEKPDWVLVQGDTVTTLASALVAFYEGYKVAHVEAGLRTYTKCQPFPEEVNRRIVSIIADLHFAPTKQARDNLLREGIHDNYIVITGNPIIDALKLVTELPPSPEVETIFKNIDIEGRKVILVTAHRRENFGKSLENICLALQDIAIRYNNKVQIIYPVHLNPNVWVPVHRLLGKLPNVTLLPPVDYFTLIHLMKQAWLILTDSGGIQEEAPTLGKPVLVLRHLTERPEGIDAGVAKVVGTDRRRIVEEVNLLFEDIANYQRMARVNNLYGDGKASQRIVASLLGEPVDPFISG